MNGQGKPIEASHEFGQNMRPTSLISFGNGSNNLIDENENAHFAGDGQERYSLISIKDIQEVRDKVPASPATKLNEP